MMKYNSVMDMINAFVDGEFTVKRIAITDKGLFLMPANNHYSPIQVSEESNFQVWGIVTHIIKSVRT